MLTNGTNITIFNKKQVGRETVWLRTQIQNVNLHGTAKVELADKGLISADEFIIRIPAASIAENKNFTVQKGDCIVIGLIDDDIQGLADLMKKYDVLTVMSVTNNLSASEYSRHIKVVCK